MITIKKAVKVERRSREVVQMQKVQTILGRVWRDIKNFRAAILALVLYNAVVRSVFRAFCPQLILTGFPCAGCGMTRAVLYILTGRFARGMQLNPAAPLSVQDAQSLSGRTAACVLQKQYSAQDFYEIIKHWKIETGSSCLGRATGFWRRQSMCCTCGSGEVDCHCI